MLGDRIGRASFIDHQIDLILLVLTPVIGSTKFWAWLTIKWVKPKSFNFRHEAKQSVIIWVPFCTLLLIPKSVASVRSSTEVQKKFEHPLIVNYFSPDKFVFTKFGFAYFKFAIRCTYLLKFLSLIRNFSTNLPTPIKTIYGCFRTRMLIWEEMCLHWVERAITSLIKAQVAFLKGYFESHFQSQHCGVNLGSRERSFFFFLFFLTIFFNSFTCLLCWAKGY